MPGKTVTLAQTGHSVIGVASGTSSSSGLVTFKVGDTTAETVTYTATDTTDGVTITDTAAVTFAPGPVSSATSTVASSPSSVIANGTLTSTITITLLDANNNPVSGKTVKLSQGIGTGSTISAASGTSNASGVVTFTTTDVNAEIVTYSAKDTCDNVSLTATTTVTFIAGPVTAAQSQVNSSPTTVNANGVATSTITVTLSDVEGNPVSGKAVALSQSTGGHSTIGAASGTSDANGLVTFTVNDSTPETVTYTATDTTDNVTITDTAAVLFYGPASAAQSQVNASPTTVAANGSATSTISVNLKDVNGSPVPGKTVTLAQTVGDHSIIGNASGTSDVNGLVTFIVKDSTPETVLYTAKDTTDNVAITDTAQVAFFGPGSASTSSVNSSPGSVTANGVATSTVTVTLLDANSVPVPGKTVTLAQSVGGNSTISAASGLFERQWRGHLHGEGHDGASCYLYGYRLNRQRCSHGHRGCGLYARPGNSSPVHGLGQSDHGHRQWHGRVHDHCHSQGCQQQPGVGQDGDPGPVVWRALHHLGRQRSLEQQWCRHFHRDRYPHRGADLYGDRLDRQSLP